MTRRMHNADWQYVEITSGVEPCFVVSNRGHLIYRPLVRRRVLQESLGSRIVFLPCYAVLRLSFTELR
jgi:hypothetical protein